MKEKLRKEIKQKRRNISKEENRKKSKEIKEKLFGLKEYKDAKIVLFYVSYDGEVFTHELIKEALDDKKVVVPISNKKDCSLSLSILEFWDDLIEGPYRILEPKKDCIKEISIDEIDLIVVPGVAFDENGNRLGHGKGYYDRLLEKTKAKTVGLAFEFQIVKNIPTDRNDVPVDLIITKDRIVKCSDRF
ncbi:5-formyltetrahydrofolate cyclo-ligase [Thermoplasmatales archaeon ex4572_165]|nr:MAG: 5-formyltetrahydrofolate cyclo-ligase [Thermoplasmatales archaeon ex4572_165]